MHSRPLISVIIHVKKSAERLKKCLDTLKLQMYNNIEIICVDTGLSIENVILLYKYQEFFDKFKIVHLTCSNSGQAWNEGLKIANGEYVHFINSDCWFMLDSYKVFKDTSAENEPDISIINSALHKEDIIDIPFYEFFDDEDLIKISDSMMYSLKDINHILTKNQRVLNKIYKKEFLKNNNLLFLERNIYSEYLFNIQTLVNSSSVYINPEAYMRHTEQDITDGAYTKKIFDIFNIITKMQEYLIKEKLLREYIFDFFNFICNSLDKYFEYCPEDFKREYFEKMKQFILYRFNSMPQEIQNGYKKIEEFNCMLTSDFEEYNNKKQI